MMNRRTFFGNLLGAGAFRALAPDTAPAFQTSDTAAPDPEVKRVLVMFKCHLDVGFIDTQANVIRKYFEQYFPHAIQTAAAMRQPGQRSLHLDHRLVADLPISRKGRRAGAPADGAGHSRRATLPGTRFRSPGRRSSWTAP